jgi:hypothetical protein
LVLCVLFFKTTVLFFLSCLIFFCFFVIFGRQRLPDVVPTLVLRLWGGCVNTKGFFMSSLDSFWTNDYLKNSIRCFFGKNKLCLGEGGCCPPITLTLKIGTRNFDYQSSESLRSLYDHPFYKTLYILRV